MSKKLLPTFTLPMTSPNYSPEDPDPEPPLGSLTCTPMGTLDWSQLLEEACETGSRSSGPSVDPVDAVDVDVPIWYDYENSDGAKALEKCLADAVKDLEGQGDTSAATSGAGVNITTGGSDGVTVKQEEEEEEDGIRMNFNCFICPAEFKGQRNYERHMKYHHSTGTGAFEYCLADASKKPKEELQHEDVKIEAGTGTGAGLKLDTGAKVGTTSTKPKKCQKFRIYKCALCPAGLKTRGIFGRHMEYHAGLRGHLCAICEDAFKHARQLREHHETHSSLRPFLCTTCKKGFKTKSQCRVHEERNFCTKND